MAFTIKKSDGSTLAVVSKSTVDTTSSSIVLHGQGKQMWGLNVNENFVHLLENFADGSPPLAPLDGQLWFNSKSNTLSIRYGSAWNALATSALFVEKTGDTMSGDLQFSIPTGSPVVQSPGIQFLESVGNDTGRIFGESDNGATKFVIQFGDDSDTDSIVFRYKDVSSDETEIITVKDSGTSIRSSKPEILKIYSNAPNFSDNNYGVIQYYTDASNPDERTAIIGFANYASGTGSPFGSTTATESSTDFTIDNRCDVASGAKAFDYREDGGLRMRYAGSGGIRIFGLSGPTVNTGGTSNDLATDLSNAAFAIAGGGYDLILGANDQVTRGNTGTSRALVKGAGGVLTVNYQNDFTSVLIDSALQVDGNLTMGSNQIKSLANGTAGTDAVNLNQLNTTSAPIFVSPVNLINVDIVGTGTTSATGWVAQTLASVGVPSTAKAIILDGLIESNNTSTLTEIQARSGFTGTGNVMRITGHKSSGTGDDVANVAQGICPVDSTGFQWQLTQDVAATTRRRIISRVVGYFS